MLNLNHDYIFNTINKARQYHVKEAADTDVESVNLAEDMAATFYHLIM